MPLPADQKRLFVPDTRYTVKQTLKKYAPAPILQVVQSGYRAWVKNAVYKYDRSRFNDSRFRDYTDATLEQLEGKLIFHSHSLEKGLSHTDIRYNFGEAALKSLVDTASTYIEKKFPRDRLAYVNAISTLRAYYDCHVAADIDARLFRSVLGTELLDEVLACDSKIGGARKLEAKSANRMDSVGFVEVFRSRASVREFAKVSVRSDRIRPAIELALHSPSVCNRQSSRVKIVTDEALIRRILQVQGGMVGYDNPPALLCVTTDLSSFMDPTERNQPFVDGGLFAMGLLLALENERLAACPLNAMMTVAEEEEVRALLSLPKSERLILFIAVGEFKPETKVPKSFRYEIDDIATEY